MYCTDFWEANFHFKMFSHIFSHLYESEAGADDTQQKLRK